MQTIDEMREYCRFVGEGIEKMVAEGGSRNAFEDALFVPAPQNRIDKVYERKEFRHV